MKIYLQRTKSEVDILSLDRNLVDVPLFLDDDDISTFSKIFNQYNIM